MEIICVYDVDLSLCDFLGKPDVIFGGFPIMYETIRDGRMIFPTNQFLPR